MLPTPATYTTYGGELHNANPVEDPTTDLDASLANEQRQDTAAMTRMCPRARVRWTYSGGVVTVASQDAVWGNGTPPTVTRSSAGVFAITWPTTVTDARGETWGLNLQMAIGNAETVAYDICVAVTGPNTATATVSLSSTGAATDPPAGVGVLVW
jgi:hypothetical protein